VIHNDDADYNTLIADTIMGNNTTAREGGDAIFYVVDSGWGALNLNSRSCSTNQRRVQDLPRHLPPHRQQGRTADKVQLHRHLGSNAHGS
jgi:hypothetical protein